MADVGEPFDNPHAWLARFGIRAHYFVWAVAHGALDDVEAARHVEGWLQLPLMPDVEPLVQPELTVAAVAYRSRAPHRSDVLVEDDASRRLRHKLGIRLQDRKPVLRG